MTPRFRAAAVTPELHVQKNLPSSGLRSRRRVHLTLAPLVLGLALVAAACGNSPSNSSPSASANALIAQGLSAEKSGHIQQALTDFNAAIAKNPASQIAYFDLGTIYQEHLNDPTQATNEYNKALLADPNYQPAMYNLATLETSSNPLAAIDLYNRLLKLNPKQSAALFNLGLLLISHNQLAQGDADLKQALALDPSLSSRLPAGVHP